MSPVQKRLVAVGVSLQSAKGEAADEPQFLMGVEDGKPVNWDIEENVIEVTGEDPLFGDVDRTSVVPGAEFTGLVLPKTIGLLLYSALGDIASSGVSAPFEHVIVPALDLPYITFFGRAFGDDYMRVADCKCDELELSWENAGHLSVALTYMGVKLRWNNIAYTPENNESIGGTPLYRAAGGLFLVDPASDTPIERNIISGSLTIANSTEAVPQSGSVEPSDVSPAVKDIEVGINVAPDDLADIRKALTGSSSGEEISQVPIYGSFDWTFVIDDDNDLQIASQRFQVMPEMPEADPAGGFLEFDLAGKVLQPPGSADAIICTLHNEHEEYVAAASGS